MLYILTPLFLMLLISVTCDLSKLEKSEDYYKNETKRLRLECEELKLQLKIERKH